AKPYGYRGYELAGILRERGIECEFADPDFLVLMTTPETGEAGLRRLTDVLTAVPKRTPSGKKPLYFPCRSGLCPPEKRLLPPV
ncbi:MAG: hypothetical protein IJB15_09475, partial [Clostridia bacterium]|nr:hypothetical protein [Clostridia bacterium]